MWICPYGLMGKMPPHTKICILHKDCLEMAGKGRVPGRKQPDLPCKKVQIHITGSPVREFIHTGKHGQALSKGFKVWPYAHREHNWNVAPIWLEGGIQKTTTGIWPTAYHLNSGRGNYSYKKVSWDLSHSCTSGRHWFSRTHPKDVAQKCTELSLYISEGWKAGL